MHLLAIVGVQVSFSIRKAVLIYNPSSGTNHHLRLQAVEVAAAELRKAGIESKLLPTQGAGTGGEQAQEAIREGHDAIFICGGDGTIHDVLQGVIASRSEVPLGLVPLGTGNVLAHDLGIPRDPAAAIRKQLTFVPKRVAAGRVDYRSKKDATERYRYFTVMAGVGADAEMVYNVTASAKSKFGQMAYNAEMFKLAFFHPYQELEAEYVDAQSGERKSISTFAVAAVRITTFPGLMGKFAPGAALERDDLTLVLTRTRNRVLHAAYFARILARQSGPVPGIELVNAREVVCRVKDPKSRVHVEADGEFLGGLPVRISAVPRAFTLLMKP
jgi:diacylglycerol kinase (ATP)